jgi:hypothetical protein
MNTQLARMFDRSQSASQDLRGNAVNWTKLVPGEAIDVTLWSGMELELTATGTYAEPYCEVEVWLHLTGPGFSKRIYGFWDGENVFRIRMTAPATGEWRFESGSNQSDDGLNGKTGRFRAVPPSAEQLAASPNLHGMLRPTSDARGLEYADGTPFFLLGDTWWSVPSYKFPLPKDDARHAIGPDADLRDYLELRRAQGFNCIALLAALPAWATDDHASDLYDRDGTLLRNAWRMPDGKHAVAMHNEGGRPFATPGKVPGFEDVVPDYDRINPAYFKVLDAKIDLISATGMVPFIEVARRDSGPAWQKYHDWPGSYVRYIQYVFTRYQAHNAIFSPIHYDYYLRSLPAAEYSAACNAWVDRYGRPPFGTMLSANANPSTLANFGTGARWLDMHQTGNAREHYTYWWMTELHDAQPTLPAIAGEPYYSGLYSLGTPYELGKPGNTPEDDMYVRSGMYGSLLSGGYAGYIYGAEGIWQSAVEPDSRVLMWDAFQWSSAETVRHLVAFATVRGSAFRRLVPCTDALTGHRAGPELGYEGWAYAAGSADRSWYLIYFEGGADGPVGLRGAAGHGARYRPCWFDPRTGEWANPGAALTVPENTVLELPARPDDRDWGLMLERIADGS